MKFQIHLWGRTCHQSHECAGLICGKINWRHRNCCNIYIQRYNFYDNVHYVQFVLPHIRSTHKHKISCQLKWHGLLRVSNSFVCWVRTEYCGMCGDGKLLTGLRFSNTNVYVCAWFGYLIFSRLTGVTLKVINLTVLKANSVILKIVHFVWRRFFCQKTAPRLHTDLQSFQEVYFTYITYYNNINHYWSSYCLKLTYHLGALQFPQMRSVVLVENFWFTVWNVKLMLSNSNSQHSESTVTITAARRFMF